MIFGEIPVAQAEGAILAHSLKLGGLVLKKGRRLSAEDVQALARAGLDRVTAARLESDDVGEDEAAARIAAAIAGPGLAAAAPFTGRVNLAAEHDGLLVFDRAALDRLNAIDEAITVATVAPFARVVAGQMVATIKIIPFAAPAAAVTEVERLAEARDGKLQIAPFRGLDAVLIQTQLAGTKASVLDKTTEVTHARLASLGSRLLGERRCPHQTEALARHLGEVAKAGCTLALVAGASAIVDRRDVIPAAVAAAGGAVEHFGMPVDPGNLLLVGRIGAMTVLGLPGCARSPKENGFDWVLQRLAAGLPAGKREIAAMGSGGFLAEIPTRPQPRAAAAPRPAPSRVAALVLAAGQSRRMGGPNKLLMDYGGRPLVQGVVEAALASRAAPVIVVLGHQGEGVRVALAGLDVAFVENPDFASGLASSLRRGLAALPPTAGAALVCLGDMPEIDAAVLDALIAVFNPLEGRSIVVPTRRGKRGNPVLFGRRFFQEIEELQGDVGARHLIGAYPEEVAEVEVPTDAVLIDVDTPQAYERLRGSLAEG